MRSAFPWHTAAAVLVIVVVACVPALVAATGVDARHPASHQDDDRGFFLNPFEMLFGSADAAEEPRAEDRPRERLRTLTTAPQRPRVADDGPSRNDLRRRNPRLRIDAPAPGARAQAAATPGVWWAAEYRMAELPVQGEEADQLRVGFVDPDGFRIFTPWETAQSEALWRGVRDGEAVLSFQAAHAVGVSAGEEISIGDGQRYRVAGIASLAPADVADVLLGRPAAHALEADVSAAILVGLDRLKEIDEVGERLTDAGLGEVSVVEAEAPYHAELVGSEELEEAIEPFTYRHRGGGLFDIDPDWIKHSIVDATVPILGEVKCHRIIIPQMRAALEEIVELELDHLLDGDDYGGCWVPRYIGFQEGRPMSMHAWGIAFDVNVHTNLYGDPPQLDKRIVEVFDRHGFAWGGDWRTPDGMHFELRELTEPSG